MGLMDRIFGQDASPPRAATGRAPAASQSADERAIERYRYLLRTAPPDAIEQAHTEAFEQLTPEQRAQVLRGLGHDASSADSSPHALARVATRAELRQPGTLERSFGGGAGMGMGGMVASSLLGSIAGSFIGTAIAHQLLEGFDDSTWGDPGEPDAAQAEDASGYGDDAGFDDAGSDFGDSLDV